MYVNESENGGDMRVHVSRLTVGGKFNVVVCQSFSRSP